MQNQDRTVRVYLYSQNLQLGVRSRLRVQWTWSVYANIFQEAISNAMSIKFDSLPSAPIRLSSGSTIFMPLS